MDRPYILCHMVTSLDGKVTGDFLGTAAPFALTYAEERDGAVVLRYLRKWEE